MARMPRRRARAARAALVLLAATAALASDADTLQPDGAGGGGGVNELPAHVTMTSFRPANEVSRTSGEPALTRIPRPVPAMAAPSNFGDAFPTGPPRPPVSNEPPPVAPSGRWLHSATIVDGAVYVYGGVGSYSSALYNDMWVYNYEERAWTQVQASYVPPFPLPKGSQNLARRPTESDSMRAPGEPAGPAFADPPSEEVTVGAVPGFVASDPVAKEQERAPLKVTELEPIPRNVIKAPGYDAFVELDARSRAHARASASQRAGVRARHEHLLAAQAGAGGDPPVFWRNNNMSPDLMSPFIAADLWKYDLDTHLWSNVRSEQGNVPSPRWLHTAVEYKGNVIVFGGVSYSDIILGDVWVFNPDTALWTKGEPTGAPILPREGHSAVVMGGKDMYVFGGISYGHVPFNDMFRYDITVNQWAMVKAKGELPPPRWLHTAVSYREVGAADDASATEKMFVFGGVTRNWIPMNDLYVFDRASETWTHPKALGFPPYPRMMHTAVMLHTTMFVHGGTANNIPLEDVWTYDIQNNEWAEENPSGPYPFARFGHAAVVVAPPVPSQQRQQAPAWVPKPLDDSVDPLTPTLRKVPSPRPAERIRKEYNFNLFALTFGGAGPKPHDSDFQAAVPGAPHARQQ